MKETVEFWICSEYVHQLFAPEECKKDNGSTTVVEISTDDPRYKEIGNIQQKMREQNLGLFFSCWAFHRKYTTEETNQARLWHLFFYIFHTAGEECGTKYDEATACPICGANAKQVTPLHLYKNKIPKRDIAKSLGGEMIVSDRFVEAVKARGLKGLFFSPIYSGKNRLEHVFQLTAEKEIELSDKTVVGCNPFDLTTESGMDSHVDNCGNVVKKEIVYKCPHGDNIGLNIISEAYVLDSPLIGKYDFIASRQRIGARIGLLRPEPVYFVSPAFRKMLIEEKLLPMKQIDYFMDVAHVVSKDGIY